MPPRVTLSDGVAAPVMPRRPAPTPRQPITRAPKPYVQPLPVGPSNPAWTPSPTVTNSQPYWNHPVSYTPSPYVNNNVSSGGMGLSNPGVTDWGSVGGGGGMPSSAPSAPAEPPPPPPPAVGGRVWYSKLGKEAKAAEDAKWLRGDSDYTDQIGQYTKALDDYKGRIKTRITQYGEDEKLARDNTNKNKTYSMNSLGEDFGARGMIDSGMFDTESTKNLERFTEALAGILKAKDRNVSGANDELADYTSENTIGRTNARRAALVRMAQNQNLIDTSALL